MRLGLGMGFKRNKNRGFVNRFYTFFNGIDEYISCGYGKQYDWNEPHTYIYVFKTTKTNYMSVYGKRNPSNYRGVVVFLQNGYPQIYFVDNAGNKIRTRTESSYNDDKFHLCIITYNGNGQVSGFKIYIDGNKETLYDIETGVLNSTIIVPQPITLGSLYGNTWYFSGVLDEIALVGRELSVVDIEKIYGKQSGDFDPTKMGDIKKIAKADLGALWRVGDKASWDGLQWKFPDLSGNGNDGTSQGMDESNVRRY